MKATVKKFVLYLREAFKVPLRYLNGYMEQTVLYKSGVQRRSMARNVHLEVVYL